MVSGIQILRKNKNWVYIIKPLSIGIVINIAFGLLLKIILWEFDRNLIIGMIIGISFCYVIYKLTKYQIEINDWE